MEKYQEAKCLRISVVHIGISSREYRSDQFRNKVYNVYSTIGKYITKYTNTLLLLRYGMISTNKL